MYTILMATLLYMQADIPHNMADRASAIEIGFSSKEGLMESLLAILGPSSPEVHGGPFIKYLGVVKRRPDDTPLRGSPLIIREWGEHWPASPY